MKLDLLLWALVLPFAWYALATVPLLLGAGAAPVSALAFVGLAGATLAAFAFERRTPLGQVLRLGWRPPRPAHVGAALLAGAGMVILASEIGNVVLSIWPPVVSDLDEKPTDPLWMRVAAESAFIVAARALVFPVLVGRALLVLIGRRRAVWATALWGGLLLTLPLDHPQGLPQLAMLIGLATWTHVASGSPWLPVAVVLPEVTMLAFGAFGLSPGIVGFDVVPPEVVFQPIWFDLLGAALLAAGAGLLIRAFEPPSAAPVVEDK